jgi:uncharacterized repeat protein (TIGR01451 family)
VNGTASFIAMGLASGSHSFYASYLGDATASASISSGEIITVTGGPLWTLSKTHLGNFAEGQVGVAYTITVTNTGVLPTTGTVTVTETPPNGLLIVSMSGQGWTCSAQTCTRTDGLIPGSSYPTITATANVAANAQTPLINTATVSGGGAVPASASDTTTVMSATPPFGYIDTPLNNATGIGGAIGVTGWALSGVGIQTVEIWREPVTNENPNGLVFIGTAEIVAGSRPDVAAAYPGYPGNNSGWGYQILTNELPNSNGQAGSGNGTYNLHALVTDNANTVADIGTRTITVNNAASALPFGTIDIPTRAERRRGLPSSTSVGPSRLSPTSFPLMVRPFGCLSITSRSDIRSTTTTDPTSRRYSPASRTAWVQSDITTSTRLNCRTGCTRSVGSRGTARGLRRGWEAGTLTCGTEQD